MRTRSSAQLHHPAEEPKQYLTGLKVKKHPKKRRLQSLSIQKPEDISVVENANKSHNNKLTIDKKTQIIKDENKRKSQVPNQEKPKKVQKKLRTPVTMKKLQDIEASVSMPVKQETESAKSKKKDARAPIMINRAPVLTMWVAVVAQREGYKFSEGLSFGKAIAGLLAQSKGRRLGIFEEPTEGVKGERKKKNNGVDKLRVFGMTAPGVKTSDGLWLALQNDKPIEPASVEAYLRKSFGSNYQRVKAAMEDLVRSYSVEEIGKVAYSLYEKFRPAVPDGEKGWGTKGVFDIESLLTLRK